MRINSCSEVRAASGLREDDEGDPAAVVLAGECDEGVRALLMPPPLLECCRCGVVGDEWLLLEYRRGLCTLFEDDEEGEPTPPPPMVALDDELLLLLNEGDEVRVVEGEEGLEWVDDVLEYECWIGIE